jgi:Lecithin retinol acyltransferase
LVAVYPGRVADEHEAARFTAGDHLRVWRPLGPFGYYHHGIYIDDVRVVQFGGRIGDKPHATIGAVPLSRFQNGGIAELVTHGGRTWWGAPRFDAIPRDVTIRRAERLVETHPEGLYDLFGYNCEQAAHFCSTNSYESYQVRGYFAVRSFALIPVALYVAGYFRRGKSSGVATAALTVWILSGLMPQALYRLQGERFMRRVGRPLLKWERGQAV